VRANRQEILSPTNLSIVHANRQEEAAEWSKAADGKEIDWNRLFQGFMATVDWPSTFFWRILADLNPDAKVILTVRDPKDWYKSMTKTILRGLGAANDSRNGGPSSELRAMAKKIVLDGTFQGQAFDEAKAIQEFEDHNQKVADQLPRERLLVYEVREGWEPICDFLSCEVPAESFPRTNVST